MNFELESSFLVLGKKEYVFVTQMNIDRTTTAFLLPV